MNSTNLTAARQAIIQAVADSFDEENGNEDRLIELTRTKLEGDPLIASLSWRDVYSVMLDRLPDAKATPILENTAHYSPLAHVCEILSSAEFSGACASFVLKALPDKEPIFFVHIPKTAGTTLKDALRASAPCLPWDGMFAQQYWLRGAYGNLGQYRFLTSHWRNHSEPLWMTGHYRLRKVISDGTFKSGHRGFTVFRHPLDIVISQLNYMATCLRRTPERRDSVKWRAQIQGVSTEFDPNNPIINGVIADRIVRSDFFRMDYGNIMSNYLGEEDLSLSSVIRNVRATGLDIVQIGELSELCAEKLRADSPQGKEQRLRKVRDEREAVAGDDDLYPRSPDGEGHRFV